MPNSDKLGKGNQVAEAVVHYPVHCFNPEDLLHFVELDEFEQEWKELGLDVESDLFAVQMVIMSDPKKAPVVPGTGGLRKFRFAPERWNTGKRGAARVCYVYFEEHWTVLLVTVYGKNEKDNLTDEEKKGIQMYIKKIGKILSERSFK
ncbi:hypothetical protein M4951_01200 [Blastopirellula sp. J2-11]|uniref:hypothetical protein n=1 Tax=Blastopirellula sp. J2-11 TaxID=2943192 RepID=UPI0021C88AC9|nr:hypothetical protein [Blastopirellula sp. J2-11]UUO06942.1 hypothetical protein M4951_01200 [Blastopirellula sp. J2-11]